MATAHAIDVTDEDAADLQFPKDGPPTCVSGCHTCGAALKEPYIRCAECRGLHLCADCFAAGVERGAHRSWHRYVVVADHFCVLAGSTWSAREELQLLDGLVECGLGNWRDVARRVGTRTPRQCEDHYMRSYVDGHVVDGLPRFREVAPGGGGPPPLLPTLPDTDDPPRYSPNSSSARAMAGYNAARGDFDVEFDNHAEADVSELRLGDFEAGEWAEVGRALQLGVLRAYQARLRERARRKTLVRRHGLIVLRRTLTWLQRYEATLTRPVLERLLPLMQLLDAMAFDYVLEGLHHAGQLRLLAGRLQQLRDAGVTRLHGYRIYRQLQQQREDRLRERRAYLAAPGLVPATSAPAAAAAAAAASPTAVAPVMPSRRPAPPLDVVGLPGYDRLTPAERSLCSTVRIVPDSYLAFRRLLTAECKRHGGLRLAQARALIKIDVNKTRKLYDFLLEEGYVQAPASASASSG